MSKHIAMIPAYLWDKYKLQIAAGETVTLSDDGSMYTVEYDVPADKCVLYECVKPFVIYYEVDGEVAIDKGINHLIPYRFVFKIRTRNLRNMEIEVDRNMRTMFGSEYTTIEVKEGRDGGYWYNALRFSKDIMMLADFAFDRYDNKAIKNRWGGSEYKDIFDDI